MADQPIVLRRGPSGPRSSTGKPYRKVWVYAGSEAGAMTELVARFLAWCRDERAAIVEWGCEPLASPAGYGFFSAAIVARYDRV